MFVRVSCLFTLTLTLTLTHRTLRFSQNFHLFSTTLRAPVSPLPAFSNISPTRPTKHAILPAFLASCLPCFLVSLEISDHRQKLPCLECCQGFLSLHSSLLLLILSLLLTNSHLSHLEKLQKSPSILALSHLGAFFTLSGGEPRGEGPRPFPNTLSSTLSHNFDERSNLQMYRCTTGKNFHSDSDFGFPLAFVIGHSSFPPFVHTCCTHL